MRQKAMLTLAIAGMFILATAAVTQANWYHKSEGSEGSTSEMTSPSSEPGMESQEFGAYEQQQPSEAGRLPSGENVRTGSDFRSGEEVQTIEAGGLEYRQGIDTGP